MTIVNQDQIDYWNGNAGTQWVRAQEQLDRLLSPLSEQALRYAKVQPDERVLDVGSGCGGTSLLLAEQASAVVGVDISAPMVAHARQRASARHNVEFIEADASLWHGSAPFQLAFSRFGVMFFNDPIAAFRNIHDNLDVDGRLCFICWRTPADNPWLAIPGAAAAPFLPEAAVSEGPNPFAFADQDYVINILTEAGFATPNFELCEATLTVGESMADAIDFLTRIGPLSRVIAELDGNLQKQALSAVEDALQPYESSGGIQLGASCWIVATSSS
jgi:SAM-dependent methyltransferase